MTSSLYALILYLAGAPLSEVGAPLPFLVPVGMLLLHVGVLSGLSIADKLSI